METPFSLGQASGWSWSSASASTRLGSGRPRRRTSTGSRPRCSMASRAADYVATFFGIRSIAYDADRGFLLNGRRVKMRGVNLHHEAGALGAAVPEGVWKRRLELLKAMGVNAIRTSHNPPAPGIHAPGRSDGLPRHGGDVRRVDHRQGAGGIQQVFRRVVRAGCRPISCGATGITRRSCSGARATKSASRPGPRASRCSSDCSTSSIARTRPAPSPPATTTSTPTTRPRRWSFSTRSTSWATTTSIAGTSVARSSPSRTGTIIPSGR